jgi:hypothetical protein
MAVEKDVVLIHFEEQPLAFARIEAIRPDVKPHWYQVTLLLLQLPLQAVTWILREAYIDGAPFTMNGKRMRIETVLCPPLAAPEERPSPAPERPAAAGKVIALADLKKKG